MVSSILHEYVVHPLARRVSMHGDVSDERQAWENLVTDQLVLCWVQLLPRWVFTAWFALYFQIHPSTCYLVTNSMLSSLCLLLYYKPALYPVRHWQVCSADVKSCPQD